MTSDDKSGLIFAINAGLILLSGIFTAVFFVKAQTINMTDGTIMADTSFTQQMTLSPTSTNSIYITPTTPTSTLLYVAKPTCLVSQAATYDQLLLEDIFCSLKNLNQKTDRLLLK